MKYISFIIIINFLFSLNNYSSNGEDWKSWNYNRKVGYVNGYIDGFSTYNNLLDETMKNEKNRDPYWLPPLIITILNSNSKDHSINLKEFDSIELSKHLDGFYYEPDNYGIKVINAIKILNLRQSGRGSIADKFLLECQKKYLKDK